MIKGSCLCGGVRFEIARVLPLFEFCHCNRCRKATGSAFSAAVAVRPEDFHLVQGKELISSYEAPILKAPPPYRICFCSRCGSHVPPPDVDPASNWFKIDAGLLDDDPGVRPDRHIFTDLMAPWYEITDELPRPDWDTLVELRRPLRRPS